jgi:hypothetical protein
MSEHPARFPADRSPSLRFRAYKRGPLPSGPLLRISSNDLPEKNSTYVIRMGPAAYAPFSTLIAFASSAVFMTVVAVAPELVVA